MAIRDIRMRPDQPSLLLWPFTRALTSLAVIRNIKADPAIAAEQMIKMTRRLTEEIYTLTDLVMGFMCITVFGIWGYCVAVLGRKCCESSIPSR